MNKSFALLFDGGIAILRMVNGENRMTPMFVKQFLGCLDEVERSESVKVLITTGEAKFYSNGLDLQTLQNLPHEEQQEFSTNLHLLYKRILTFPTPTIAAINGHAYAAGAILALSHDYLIMKQERGWLCLPEIKLLRPFPVSLMGLIKAKIPSTEYLNAIVMGKRYTAKEATDTRVIQEMCPGTHLMERAITIAKEYCKQDYDREMLSQFKNDVFFTAVKSITDPPTFYPKL